MDAKPVCSGRLRRRMTFSPIWEWALGMGGVPPEDVKAVAASPHFESTEGQATKQETVLQVVLVEEGHLSPSLQGRQLPGQVNRDLLADQADTRHESHQLLPKRVLQQLSILLLPDDGPLPAQFLII